MSDTTDFWKGDFGDNYNKRNHAHATMAAYTAMWGKILARTTGVKAILELGCGTGMNLRALSPFFNIKHLMGVDANAEAVQIAQTQVPRGKVIHADILGDLPVPQHDLVFTRGVLIHIEPENLAKIYATMVSLSERYIMVAEYFNPTPVEIPYRGHAGKLWKRDFAGEMMDIHGLKLVDYGFVYDRGPFPQDNITWFLMEKP